MSQNQLKEQLQSLHEALKQSPALDDEAQALLQQIAVDIGDLEVGSPNDLSERVQEQAVRFEQEHPTLSEILREIVDTLGRIGV
ncbi:DUF4404 family protein [Thalassolituus sp. LLYu03]|uniref:DUF4404 family protein n=1 Tax=Thalassolituus sp. LLYu03 TaxID=3421656 RepID=UPI003D2E7702